MERGVCNVQGFFLGGGQNRRQLGKEMQAMSMRKDIPSNMSASVGVWLGTKLLIC